MRSPSESASWTWNLDDVEPPGLESALTVVARMSQVLREHGLLVPPFALEWDWFVYGSGGIGVTTRLSLRSPLADPELPAHVLAARPVGFPDASVGSILVVGSGTWIDAAGEKHREHRLVELTVAPDAPGIWAELAVFHDIWGPFDFRGLPHPDVEQRNAPRLAAALQSLDALLGVSAEPGDTTYFGSAEGHGIKAPEAIDGHGPDLTDLL
ncbi:hypothetical protein JIX56_28525 [Streptomyces sp. CA-210063]|uniref:hypothetical protein n=1 Tax=Streptomyces sp. CA-210063 TaxID=2801029 RepID=UPI00214BD992|nr:hypothetical protein [Streptomyces sp. CA-210063]UUU37182.1 hypothetical protein JIX56_28525 [Streptomyces sp. CA-210063]